MQIPRQIPGLKWATALLGLYGMVWMALEGTLLRETLLGASATAVALAHLTQRFLGARRLPRALWLLAAGGLGALGGAGSAILTLVFMALKTGLHAHGPEFTPAEINWVAAQIPLWTATGGLTGVGLGLIVSAAWAEQPNE